MRILIFLLLATLTSGCELWFDDDQSKKGDLIFETATSPKGELSSVSLPIDKIEIQHSADQWHELTLKDSSIDTNIQKHKATDHKKLTEKTKLPKGKYKNLRIRFAEPVSFVTQRQDEFQFELALPNEIVVPLDNTIKISNEESQTAQLWWDLSKSLARVEDNDFIRYEFTSEQAVQVFSEKGATVSGDISPSALSDLSCDSSTDDKTDHLLNGYVYVFNDDNEDAPHDIGPGTNEDVLITLPVYLDKKANGEQYYYQSPKLAEDKYQLAFTCGDEFDHPNFDNDISFSSVQKLNLKSSTQQTVNFD